MSHYGFPPEIYRKIVNARTDMLDNIKQPNMISRQSMTSVPFFSKSATGSIGHMYGGIRQMDHPLPGYFSPTGPATLATGSRIGSMMNPSSIPSAQKHRMMKRYIGRGIENPEELDGGKINWKKVGRSASHVLGTIKKAAMPVLKEIAPIAKQAILKYGKDAVMNYLVPAAETAAVVGAGISRRRHSSELVQGSGRKPNARAQIVKQVMSKRGCSMIEASKIVKAEGLY